MATIVTGGFRDKVDGKVSEIKRQLRQKGGYPHNPKLLERALQLIVEGRFADLGLKFQRLADLVPQGFKVIEDCGPTANLDISQIKFKPLLKDGESSINSETMSARAVEMNGNLGLEDSQFFLDNQHLIPLLPRGKCLVFTGTKLLDQKNDDRYVVCLERYKGRWQRNLYCLDVRCDDHERLPCSE